MRPRNLSVFTTVPQQGELALNNGLLTPKPRMLFISHFDKAQFLRAIFPQGPVNLWLKSYLIIMFIFLTLSTKSKIP